MSLLENFLHVSQRFFRGILEVFESVHIVLGSFGRGLHVIWKNIEVNSRHKFEKSEAITMLHSLQ